MKEDFQLAKSFSAYIFKIKSFFWWENKNIKSQESTQKYASLQISPNHYANWDLMVAPKSHTFSEIYNKERERKKNA